jgi:hypothetical protein
MNETLILTISVLIVISVLFLLAALNSKAVSGKKKANIYSKLGDLKGLAESEEGAIRRDTYVKLDNLLSKALQYRYGNNKSCGENLKTAKKIFRGKEYQDVWDVHKIRNKIVHNDLEVSREEAIHAYKIYKMSISKILR